MWFASAGLAAFGSPGLHVLWRDVSEPCDKVSNGPLAKRAVGRPGFFVPHAIPPGASAPLPPTALVIATFSRCVPQMDRLRGWGKRDVKSRGEDRRRRGWPY